MVSTESILHIKGEMKLYLLKCQRKTDNIKLVYIILEYLTI